MVTLYHWDMPATLAAAGGWENRQSIDWFAHYADVVFANFADQVDLFVLVNEPSVEQAQHTLASKRRAGDSSAQLAILPSADTLGRTLRSFNHILLASAEAKRRFSAKGYQGRLGLALPLFPTKVGKDASYADGASARFADGVLNRWFLDAIYKGTYPADVLEVARRSGLDLDIEPKDAATVKAAAFDYLGINYYSPLYIRRQNGEARVQALQTFIPESSKAAVNGAVEPDEFGRLLDRIRTSYGNPTVFITENGAGFPNDDTLVNGAVHDRQRCLYLVDHIAAMQGAIARGADVRGYHVWSSHDNLEWLSGYGSRFGMIYVDFDTQRRVVKDSAKAYARIVAGEKPDKALCSS
jgi:beta-glucosidase